jgi:hypothetical protein
MIRFLPNGAQMALTNDQLSSIYRLSAGHDVEVVDHDHTDRITLYVNHGDHEIRHEIEVDGVTNGVERGSEADGWDWMPADVYEPELGQVWQDGTVTVRLIGEPGKTMGHEAGPREPQLRDFFVTALVALADRISTGRYDDICVDYIPDMAGETPDLLCNVSYGGYHDA